MLYIRFLVPYERNRYQNRPFEAAARSIVFFCSVLNFKRYKQLQLQRFLCIYYIQ